MLFQQSALIMSRREHLTNEGRHELSSIRASMNRGVKTEGIIATNRPSVGIISALNPH
jgi:hypothetical protein